MNPVDLPPGTTALPLTAAARANIARDRLTRNRERLSGWLEQDRHMQSGRSSAGWLAGALWPVLKGLGTQPVASLALGALTQTLLRRAPVRPGVLQPSLQSQALGFALAVLRRYPKTTLALAGAALLWGRRTLRDPRSPTAR